MNMVAGDGCVKSTLASTWIDLAPLAKQSSIRAAPLLTNA
jgi:hypothetical protein